jgi:hypothetical protein
LLSLAGGTLGIIAAMKQAREAETEVNKLRRQGKLDTEEGSAAVLDATEAQLALIEKVREYKADLQESGDTQAQVRAKLQALAAQLGITSEEFRDAFPNIARVADGLERINRLPRQMSFSISTDFNGTHPGQQEGIATGGIVKAARGMIARSPTYLVGEGGYSTFAGRGAEAVIPLDGRGISILAEAVRRGMGTGKDKPGLVVNLNVSGAMLGDRRRAASELADMLTEELGRRNLV